MIVASTAEHVASITPRAIELARSMDAEPDMDPYPRCIATVREAAEAAGASALQKLDVVVNYMIRVHLYDFYSGAQASSPGNIISCWHPYTRVPGAAAPSPIAKPVLGRSTSNDTATDTPSADAKDAGGAGADAAAADDDGNDDKPKDAEEASPAPGQVMGASDDERDDDDHQPGQPGTRDEQHREPADQQEEVAQRDRSAGADDRLQDGRVSGQARALNQIADRILPPANHADIGVSLARQAMAHLALEQFSEACDCLTKALELSPKETGTRAKILNNLGVVHYHAGDGRKAVLAGADQR